MADAENDEKPKSMAECLESEDPVAALLQLADDSTAEAEEKTKILKAKLESISPTLPDLLVNYESPAHPLASILACASSVNATLTKIATGGSQASQEIRALENEKREMDQHADAVAAALQLRQASTRATQSLSAAAYGDAAEAIKPYIAWKDQEKEDTADKRIREYAGEYAMKQLEEATEKLKASVTDQYESAVKKSDLQALGHLTPILSILQLEKEALRLYKVYLDSILETSMAKAAIPIKDQPPYASMARIYNAAVATLRHHLPMVAHCLYKADGAAAVLQLVHVQTETAVLPVIQAYSQQREFPRVAETAADLYQQLVTTDDSDCGFQDRIGTLADTDSAMDETAKCIQTAETYLRFCQQTASEVNKARKLRHEQAMRQERYEWESSAGGAEAKEHEAAEYQDMVILPPSTPLHETVTELGGQYALIERCLLLATMQKAFLSNYDENDSRYFRPLSVVSETDDRLQTTLVETCLYATRRSLQRAFATGHCGTASACLNFCVECLNDTLTDVLTRRAEDEGVHLLKEALMLSNSAALFNNASNLIKQGNASAKEEMVKKQKAEQTTARACAVMNDLEVAVRHTEQLEQLLRKTIERSYPTSQHEGLHLCLKSLEAVSQNFVASGDSAVDSLESILKPRIRNIVNDAVGSEATAGGAFMAAEKLMRMNYNLDEEMYNMLEISESYGARLCSQLNDLLDPLRRYLSPRLWDRLLIGVLNTVCKRLETSIRKCQFTALGALALDADVRDLVNYAKERLLQPPTTFKGHLGRLSQIARLLSVDDLDDVADLVSSARRKKQWDLKNEEDVKALLLLRIDFDEAKINRTVRLPKDS